MKILFITYTNIGDVVMSTPLLNRIIHDHPHATVDIIVGGRAAELFEGFPNIGKLMTLKKKKHHMHYWYLRQELKHDHYDLVVDLRTPFFKHFVSCDKAITFKSNKAHGKKVEQLGRLWPSNLPLNQKVWINPRTAELVAQEAAKHTAPLIALGPTANWAGKQWPQKNFNELVERLLQDPKYKDAIFVLLGAPNERNDILTLIDAIPDHHKIDLVGKTNIAESYAWINACQLFIGHDSGLSHLAAAAGTPSLTLFGPMDDAIYAPWSPVARTVTPPFRAWSEINLPKKKYLPRVITDISVDDVIVRLTDDLAQKELSS